MCVCFFFFFFSFFFSDTEGNVQSSNNRPGACHLEADATEFPSDIRGSSQS